jgi:hypothetical protein
MDLLLRTFFVVNGQIKRIGLDRFSRICSDGLPKFAGQKIPYALLAFDNEIGKLGELQHHSGKPMRLIRSRKRGSDRKLSS